jgi:tRNA (guanine37-N1)-methyltransferase
MKIDVITIFPDYLAPLGLSLVGKARESGVLRITVHDLRAWAGDRHRSVDDTPYGGGAGMVMRPDVWGDALDSVTTDVTTDVAGDAATDASTPPRLIVPTPSGQPFDQRMARELADEPWLVFACGRYEGIDARVTADAERRMPVTEVSIGDYVLNGGEAAVLVMIEAVARLLPGVVGNPESLVEESHGTEGLLEYPVYTKPPAWRGLDVPEVLLSGHHARIARWRRDEALRRTVRRRPDLLGRLEPDSLDQPDRDVLSELGFSPPPRPMAD